MTVTLRPWKPLAPSITIENLAVPDVQALATKEDIPENHVSGPWEIKNGRDKVEADQPCMSIQPAKVAANEEPTSCTYGGGKLQVTKHGVEFIGTDKKREELPPVWICSPLRVIAKTRDAKSGEWGRLLEWFDDDNVRHQWAMPLELLEGDGIDVRKELARRGLHTGTTRKGKELLTAYIKVWPVNKRARCVDRLGWHDGAYAMPSETIGGMNEPVVFQNSHAVEPAFGAAGTLATWRQTVGALAAGNSRIVFSISVAFAGALADIVGEDSGGFQLRGRSSTGKSTALKAAASVWGNPDTYMRMWRATANGLEGLASLHNDGILILDELSQCDPKQAGEAAYMLANGQGKARANQSGAARASYRWRLLFLSSGEVSLSTLMAQAGRKANTGQEVRMADFEADAGVGFGAFEDLHDRPSGAAMSTALKDAAALNHGAVGRAWLQQIVQRRASLVKVLGDSIRQFVADVVPANAAGQVERALMATQIPPSMATSNSPT